jgi:hypothetical protein
MYNPAILGLASGFSWIPVRDTYRNPGRIDTKATAATMARKAMFEKADSERRCSGRPRSRLMKATCAPTGIAPNSAQTLAANSDQNYSQMARRVWNAPFRGVMQKTATSAFTTSTVPRIGKTGLACPFWPARAKERRGEKSITRADLNI